jgi:hypothetical protein
MELIQSVQTGNNPGSNPILEEYLRLSNEEEKKHQFNETLPYDGNVRPFPTQLYTSRLALIRKYSWAHFLYFRFNNELLECEH